MNSIQLISKINSRIEDLAMLSQEVLKPNGELSNIEKEVIKRNCSDLYELILKLKTSNDLSDEQLAMKENLSQEIRNNEFNFKEVISNSFQDDLSINTIAENKLQEAEVEPVFYAKPVEVTEEEVIIIEAISEPIIETIPEVIIEEKKEIFEYDSMLAIEPIILANEEIENLIFEPVFEPVFEDEIIPVPNEIHLPQTIIINEPIEPKIVEAPVFEIKLVNEEMKEKPASFFSIGKTVMPKTEPSLNEKIAQKLDGFQLSEKIIEPKIDNLKTAISLNKKIAFVNELFKENVVEYAKSIDKINSSTDLNQAMLIWTELKLNHNWNTENTLVKDLEKLIQRRFS